MLQNLRQSFDDHKIDALLVTDKSNIFYLTGFKGSNGAVLVTKNHIYLFTDARYTEKADKVTSKECRVIDIAPGFMNVLHNILIKHRVKSFGIESENVSVALYKSLDSLNGFIITDTVHLIEQLRMIKSAEELRALRQAQKLNEQALKLLLNELKVGITETETAWKLRLIINDLGADDFSFNPIIAFGANTSMPHHEVSPKKKLKRGDVILIDMGLMYKNFASDMTRTFFTKKPTSQQEHVYNTVLGANMFGIKESREGATADDVDKAARKFISDAGFKKKFGHATGHGIGLDVHEIPRIGKHDETVLEKGMVITVEPGVYLPGKLGVRIEDMVEITKKGNKVLNSFAKDLKSSVIKL